MLGDPLQLQGKPSKSTLERLQHFLTKPAFVVTWLLPWITFTLMVALYGLNFSNNPLMFSLASGLLFLLSLNLLALRNVYPILLSLSICMCLAVSMGTLGGLYVDDTYGIFPTFYKNTRLYTNIDPSQSSSAVSDAGKLVFTSDSYVATNSSVSYITEGGDVYCIAPIRDSSPSRVVEYWAVGDDCCNSEGGFWCDSASDPTANSGVVIFDNMGLFGASRKDYYEKARKKAEATYLLTSDTQPMYVRWVTESELSNVSNWYFAMAGLMTTLFSLVYLFISAGLAYALYRPSKLPLIG